MSDKAVYVIGAGVIGLTSAIRIQESKLLNPTKQTTVYLIADQFYSDPLAPTYASTIAGAHHLTSAGDGDEANRWRDGRTFQVMWEQLEKDTSGDIESGSGLMKLDQYEFFGPEYKHPQFLEGHPEYKSSVQPDNLPKVPLGDGIQFKTFTMTPSIYLARLTERFVKNGGVLVKYHFNHIHQVADCIPGIKPTQVILCTGLGSATLGGVLDKDMYPLRGQVIVIKAPWIKSGRTIQLEPLATHGRTAYVIPRVTGEVVLGGTFGKNDWNPHPRKRQTDQILANHIKFWGSTLFPPGTAAKDMTVDALRKLVVQVVVGYRPSRVGGPKIGRLQDFLDGLSIQVFANYGHGGSGWQGCWGSADQLIESMGGERCEPLPQQFAKFTSSAHSVSRAKL